MWTLERLTFSASDYFARLEKAILSAQKSIDLESYIFLPDETGTHFFELLAKRASEGLSVRVIVDGVGSLPLNEVFIQKWRERGVEIRVFHPVFFPVSPKLLRYFFSKINHRNHRKLCVIDKTRGFISSANIMAPSLDWLEVAVEVEGEEIATLERTFEIMWKKSYRHKNPLLRLIPIKGMDRFDPTWVQFNYTQKLRKKLNKQIHERIAGASGRVWLITPYFVPPLSFISSLKKAKRNGADIRIIIPEKSDIKIMPWIALYFVRLLLTTGIEVYRYSPKILHAKFILIDNWLSIGSMNLNHRSFYLDVETNVVLSLKSTLSQACEEFTKLQDHSLKVRESDYEKKNLLIVLWVRFALLMKGWM